MEGKKERNVLIGKRSRQNFKLARVSGPLIYKLKNRTLYDKHCWVCHMECTAIICTECTRSYHAKCVVRPKKKCGQCKSLDKSQLDWQKTCVHSFNLKPTDINFSKSAQQKLSKLLELLLGRFVSRNELEELKFNMDYESLIEIMDFKMIDSKIDDSKYESVEHFMSDVKRLRHNCYIMHSDNYEMIKLVESFVKFCEDESYDIGLCAECYERKRTGVENVVTTVCNVPHLVVWAKMDSYPYWPAKIVAVKKKRVEIIFFGQHDTASIKYTKCRLFSEHSPNSKLESNYEKEFRASYMEAHQYIQNVKNKFGSYHFPTMPAKFCAKKLNEQRTMIIQSIQNEVDFEHRICNSGSNVNIEPPSLISYFERTSNEIFV